jgi:AcrR family transcriptional regulator
VRTRAAILEAVLDLVRTGAINPTAAEIAARAKVSLRSIAQHFPSRGDLFAAAAARYQERPDSPEPPPELPLTERLDAFLPVRARELEASRPIRASAAQFAGSFPVVAEAVRGNAARRRAQVARVFAPELAGRDDRLELVDLALGGRVWDALRERELSQAQAQALVRQIVLAAVAV